MHLARHALKILLQEKQSCILCEYWTLSQEVESHTGIHNIKQVYNQLLYSLLLLLPTLFF